MAEHVLDDECDRSTLLPTVAVVDISLSGATVDAVRRHLCTDAILVDELPYPCKLSESVPT
ncbi:hypothetical protein [Nocardia sp. NPDC051463]|uniref:hypothetical protein n=1 Tax=Nocardia sp. NPDC051463 TaxID=3154845 RepID=UPI0034282706